MDQILTHKNNVSLLLGFCDRSNAPDLCVDVKIDAFSSDTISIIYAFKNSHYFLINNFQVSVKSPNRIIRNRSGVDYVDAALNLDGQIILLWKHFAYTKKSDQGLKDIYILSRRRLLKSFLEFQIIYKLRLL
jgi:hypothetical protein